MFRAALWSVVMLTSTVLCYKLTPELQEVFDALHNACRDEAGADDRLIKRAQGGDFVDDGNLKCYMKCVMQEMSTMDENGRVDPDAAYAILPAEIKDRTGPAILACGSPVGVDACDSAFLTFKCYYEGDKEEFFLP